MSNIIPRSCNYSNIEKIIEQARYDEDKNQYYLPEPTREDVQFPQMGNSPITTNGRIQQQNHYIIQSKLSTPPPSTIEYEDDFIVPNGNGYSRRPSSEDIDRHYVRNFDSSNLPPEKTRIKRQEQLLNQNSILQRAKHPLQMNNDNDYMNRRLNPYDTPARLSRKYGFSTDKQ